MQIPIKNAYRKLDYITFSGTEYILTDNLPTFGQYYSLKFSIHQFGSARWIIGTNGDPTSSPDTKMNGLMRMGIRTSPSGYIQCRWGRDGSSNQNLYTGTVVDTLYEFGLRIPMSDPEAVFTVFNSSGTTLAEKEYTLVEVGYQGWTYQYMNPFVIMGSNNQGTPDSFNNGNVYSFQVRSGNAQGTLLNNYYPAQRKSDGLCGLYDTVNNVFVPMAGTNITTAAAGPTAEENPGWDRYLDVTAITIPEGSVKKIEDSNHVVIWAVSLASITISGQTTTFNVNDTWSFGGTVTAYYSNGMTANVTNSSVFDTSNVNMGVAGVYTVYVSYTEGGITQTAYYSIQVSAIVPQGTVTHSVAELATAYSWTNALWINGVAFDYENATPLIYINGTNLGGASYHSPKYYSASPGTLRCYGTDVSTSLGQNYMTLELTPTKKFKKINITYTTSTTSIKLFVSDGLHDSSGMTRQQLTSATDFDVSSMNTYRLMLYTGANSTGAGANGNTRISSITVEYE